MSQGRTIFIQSLLYGILVANFLAVFLIHFFGQHTFFLAIKDGLLLALLFGHVMYVRKQDVKQFKAYFLILILFVVVFILGAQPAMVKIASLRQLAAPFGIVCLGYLLSNTLRLVQLENWLKNSIYFLSVGSVVLYLGLIFELLPMQAWGEMKQLALSIFDIPYMFYDGLSGDFVRNVSTFLDPINLGHYLVFALLYFFYVKKAAPLFLLLIGVLLGLTMCKGAFLQLALSIYIIERKRLPQWLFYLGLVSTIPLLYWASLHHDGIALHLHGLKEAFAHLSLFGEGLGAVGNQAVLFNGTSSLPIYDTYLGSLLGQLGLFGLVCWLLPFVVLGFRLKNHMVLQAVLITQLLMALISENAFNFLSVFPLMLFLGFYLQTENEK